MNRLAVKWLPDETFYSICSRQHAYLGKSTSSATTACLFGTRKKYAHDFTYNLDALDRLMASAWGSPDTIINEHTIVPFFFPFQSPQNILTAQETLRGPKLGSLKYRLGLLTGRFGAEHPLKACAACMASDRLGFGVAYWHLSHQFPGVIVCPEHGLYLRECTKNRQWSGCFEWILPTEETLLPSPRFSALIADQRILEKLTAAIMDLASIGSRRGFDPNVVSAVYRTTVAEYGAGSSGLQAAAHSLAAYTSRLQPHPPFSCLPNDAQGAATFLGSLLRKPRGHFHPLKHLTVITWLFGSFLEFINLHDQFLAQHLHRNRIPPVNKGADIAHGQICAMPILPVVRRPKIIKPDLRAAILVRLSRGDAKSAICAEFSITISALNKLLRAEPIIREAWHTISHAKNKLDRRLTWEETVRWFPTETAKQLRFRIPSVYSWLYRNDREWLRDQLAELPSGRVGNHSGINWNNRDHQLRIALMATAHDLIKTYELPLTKQLIFPALPKLATALEKKQAYRLTRSLLHKLTSARPETANRIG